MEKVIVVFDWIGSVVFVRFFFVVVVERFAKFVLKIFVDFYVLKVVFFGVYGGVYY